jgi:PAS domain-containing protein
VAIELNNSLTRAILHALPTALIALDETDTIVLANNAATKLLHTSRDRLEGGTLSRFIGRVEIGSTTREITFHSSENPINLLAAAKDVIVDDTLVRVILLKSPTSHENDKLLEHISGLAHYNADPFEYVCATLIDLGITKEACIRSTTSTKCDILFSSTTSTDIFSSRPAISRTISQDEITHLELVVTLDEHRGLTQYDLAIIDTFISLLHLRVDTQESATDATGSETALALALKAGDMGMCFFDIQSGDCYLSDGLANWCGINVDNFSGRTDAWLDTFREDDRKRMASLFSEIESHKKFKTIVHIHTLEQDIRLELFGRPLTESASHEWVVIARPYSDSQEVEAAWHTRIAMEEAAREETEQQLEFFESSLNQTLLPTTSDVQILNSRQDAGTWHIVRQLDARTSIYCVGAVTAPSRAQAVIGATLVATIADVLAFTTQNVDKFVDLVRDHARARDIETSIVVVRVDNTKLSTSSHAGASAFISGKPFVGEIDIDATTALSLSSHSEASPETIDVASNGRPWRILTTVIEVLSLIDFSEQHEEEEIPEDEPVVVSHEAYGNVSPLRSGSISPS